jgi:molybdopterin-guanine dinucleotide biosynthesis protein A
MNTLPFEIPCVILCGGKSSRMGEDKALLPFSNFDTLSQYQYEKFKPFFKKVYISSKTNKFDFDVNLILDKSNIYSPIVALKSIFESLKDEKKIFIISVDTPFIKIETIKKLIDNSLNYEIVVPKTEKVHNLCAVFDKSSLLFIEKMLSEDIHKVGYLLKNCDTKIIKFYDEDEFLNLNDKITYNKASLYIR